jgi:hypothetical protein
MGCNDLLHGWIVPDSCDLIQFENELRSLVRKKKLLRIEQSIHKDIDRSVGEAPVSVEEKNNKI